jgi:hypothetical protein
VQSLQSLRGEDLQSLRGGLQSVQSLRGGLQSVQSLRGGLQSVQSLRGNQLASASLRFRRLKALGAPVTPADPPRHFGVTARRLSLIAPFRGSPSEPQNGQFALE